MRRAPRLRCWLQGWLVPLLLCSEGCLEVETFEQKDPQAISISIIHPLSSTVVPDVPAQVLFRVDGNGETLFSCVIYLFADGREIGQHPYDGLETGELRILMPALAPGRHHLELQLCSEIELLAANESTIHVVELASFDAHSPVQDFPKHLRTVPICLLCVAKGGCLLARWILEFLSQQPTASCEALDNSWDADCVQPHSMHGPSCGTNPIATPNASSPPIADVFTSDARAHGNDGWTDGSGGEARRECGLPHPADEHCTELILVARDFQHSIHASKRGGNRQEPCHVDEAEIENYLQALHTYTTFPGRKLDLWYEDMVSAPIVIGAQLGDFLGTDGARVGEWIDAHPSLLRRWTAMQPDAQAEAHADGLAGGGLEELPCVRFQDTCAGSLLKTFVLALSRFRPAVRESVRSSLSRDVLAHLTAEAAAHLSRRATGGQEKEGGNSKQCDAESIDAKRAAGERMRVFFVQWSAQNEESRERADALWKAAQEARARGEREVLASAERAGGHVTLLTESRDTMLRALFTHWDVFWLGDPAWRGPQGMAWGFERAQVFVQELYRHQSVNPLEYERSCIWRWFVIASCLQCLEQHASGAEDSSFLALDLDVVLLSSPLSLFSAALQGGLMKQEAILLGKGFAVAWAPAGLLSFLNYVEETYMSESVRLSRLHRLGLTIQLENGTAVQHFSDTNLLVGFVEEGSGGPHPTRHFGYDGGEAKIWDMEAGRFIVVQKRGAKVMLGRNQTVLGLIHFQGPSKGHLVSFARWLKEGADGSKYAT